MRFDIRIGCELQQFALRKRSAGEANREANKGKSKQ
jgi:hypothetical protein